MSPDAVPAVVQRFVDATNAADSEGFVAAFTPDALLSDWGREFRGSSEIASWNQSDNIGVGAHFEVVSVVSDKPGARYVVTIAVTGGGFNGTGPMIFEVHNDRISRLLISG